MLSLSLTLAVPVLGFSSSEKPRSTVHNKKKRQVDATPLGLVPVLGSLSYVAQEATIVAGIVDRAQTPFSRKRYLKSRLALDPILVPYL